MKRLLCLIMLVLGCATYGQMKDFPYNNLSVFPMDSANLQQANTFEMPPWRARRFNITAGSFFPINNTQIMVGSNERDFGTTIDLEDDLGFNDFSYSFMANGQWRISKRSRFELEYFYLNRKSTHTLERKLEFKDHTYEVNARVSAFFDVSIVRFFYSYAFVAKPTYEIGALIGSHVIFGDVGMQVDTETGSAEVSDNFDFTAPIPDIGIWTDIQLSKKFGLYANANYLSLTIDNIKGRVLSTNISLLYNIHNNISLKAGYNSLNFRVDVEKERLDGFFKWGYNGPMLTLTYAFGEQVKI